MRSAFSSKSPKMPSRPIHKQPPHLAARPKHPHHPTPRYDSFTGAGMLERGDFFKLANQKEVDQWIFNDEKLKSHHHSNKQNYQIRNRISFHRRDRNSKVLVSQGENEGLGHEFRGISTQLPNQRIARPQPEDVTFSKQLIANQQNSVEPKLLNHIARPLTHRCSAHSGLKKKRHVNTSMQAYSEGKNLKPTAFSIELKKASELEEKVNSPRRGRNNKKTTLSPRSKKNQVQNFKDKFMQRQFSFTTNSQPQKFQKDTQMQKQRFMLNGWEVQSPSFHQFDQLYRQKSRELQKIPSSNQAKAFKKIVRIVVK